MARKKKITEEIPVEQVEEVVTAVENKETEQREYTEEERKRIDEFYDAMIKRQLRPRVQEVSHYMDLTHKNLDDLYNDLEAKTCGLSALNRSFLNSFERHFINDLFDKKYQ